MPVGVTVAPPGPAYHAQHRARASNPDGWLHRSAWVSFMTQGSPTSLSRHQPAAEANTALRLPPQPHHCPESPQRHPDPTPAPEQGLRQPTQDLQRCPARLFCFKSSFYSTHGRQPCLRCCHTARGKWAATGRTARSARCPLAAGCRTQAPFSPRRRPRDHQSLDRSAEPSEVKNRKNGRIRNITAIFTSTYED